MFIFVYFFTQTDPTRTVQRSAFCRSRRELSNAYVLAKFGFDTAETISGYGSNVTIVIYLFVPLRYLQFLKIVRSTAAAAAAAENELFKVR